MTRELTRQQVGGGKQFRDAVVSFLAKSAYCSFPSAIVSACREQLAAGSSSLDKFSMGHVCRLHLVDNDASLSFEGGLLLLSPVSGPLQTPPGRGVMGGRGSRIQEDARENEEIALLVPGDESDCAFHSREEER